MRLLIPVCFVLAFIGCRTSKPSVIDARLAFANGDLQSASDTLHALSQGPRRTRRESELDLAIVDLALGDTESAIATLRASRDHFDTIEPGVHAGDAIAMASDDNARPFALSGYEQVMLRTLLAMCSLADDAVDAEAYCLQAQRKQQELARFAEQDGNTEVPPMPIAVVPYLRGVLREATHQDYDDAERSFRLVSAIRPDFAPAGIDIQRAATGSHSQSGHGVLYVIALTGRGPQLVETTAPTTTATLQLASTILRHVHHHQEGKDDQPVLPNLAEVKVPQVVIPPSNIHSVGVHFDNQLLGATQSLTNLGELAIQQSEARMKWTIARAIARRALKEASITATANQLGLEGGAAAAFEFAAINAWSATEKADTRCWGLLPREIQVLRAELPAGPNTVMLSALGCDGQIQGAPIPYSVMMEDGRNRYVIVIAPDQIVSVVP